MNKNLQSMVIIYKNTVYLAIHDHCKKVSLSTTKYITFFLYFKR